MGIFACAFLTLLLTSGHHIVEVVVAIVAGAALVGVWFGGLVLPWAAQGPRPASDGAAVTPATGGDLGFIYFVLRTLPKRSTSTEREQDGRGGEASARPPGTQ